jgi:hypothetical protein
MNYTKQTPVNIYRYSKSKAYLYDCSLGARPDDGLKFVIDIVVIVIVVNNGDVAVALKLCLAVVLWLVGGVVVLISCCCCRGCCGYCCSCLELGIR